MAGCRLAGSRLFLDKGVKGGGGNWSGQGDEQQQHASIDFSAAARRRFLAVRFNRVSAVSSAAKEFPD